MLSASYNAADQVTGMTFSSYDSETFQYDSNTGRMTQYKATVNGSQAYRNLYWNANGTLQKQTYVDPFNATINNVSSLYAYDDLARLSSAGDGHVWQQSFTYDTYGNIKKSGNVSFQPTYSSASNRMTAIAGCTPTYDANGNLMYDCLHNYTWNAYGKMASVDGTTMTYDGLGRLIEKTASGVSYQFFHAPTGQVMVYKQGQGNWLNSINYLPGGARAEWPSTCSSGSCPYFKFVDHLGTGWFVANTKRAMVYDGVSAPFGETYAEQGTPERTFTGMDQNVSASSTSGLYDFFAREYSQVGRWLSPDPAGMGAVDPTNPQTWNRYAYVSNNPLGNVDPLGLCWGCMIQEGPGGGGWGWGGGGGAGTSSGAAVGMVG